MSEKNKKQFGVWMDSVHATIVGRENVNDGNFIILGHVKADEAGRNSNEKTANNHEISITHKFFKEIANKMPNVDEIHLINSVFRLSVILYHILIYYKRDIRKNHKSAIAI